MLSPERLRQWAEPYRPQIVQFLQDLIRLPSVNGRDTEVAVAMRLVQEAERLGLSGRLFAATPARPNALVEWGHGESGFALIAHMDTVAPGDAADWSLPPFAAEAKQGRLYGRGAADNKAGIACGLYTLAILRDHGLLDPAAVRVLLAAVVDEESGASSPLGVRYLLDNGNLPVRGAIYTYAGDGICIGHRGLLRLVLRATGQAIHSGSPAWSRGEGGVNAVTGLAAVLLALEQLQLEVPSHPAFPGLSCTITPGTRFEGGEFESMVPATASALVDIRLMPGQTAAEVIAAGQQIIASEEARRPGLVISIEIKNNLPAAVISPDHRLVRLAEEYTAALTGQRWAAAAAGPANEGYMLIQAGIPTLCGFGPQGGNAHAPDEWVELESLTTTVAMYAGIIHDYCNGTEEIEDDSSTA